VKNGGVEFRIASRTDRSDLLRLIRAYYRFDGIRFQGDVMPRALDRLLRDRSLGRIWIARHGRNAVGYALLSFNYDLEFGGMEGYVTDLYLSAPYRGRGLGKRALDVIEAYCRSSGIRTLELQVVRGNSRALAFYRRVGFEKLPRIVMQKELRLPARG
jgi:GNAT superfamily N-acetyltransferase